MTVGMSAYSQKRTLLPMLEGRSIAAHRTCEAGHVGNVAQREERMKQFSIVAAATIWLAACATAQEKCKPYNSPSFLEAKVKVTHQLTQMPHLPSEIEWGPKYATPGVRLSICETSRTNMLGLIGQNVILYELIADGFPTDKVYDAWMYSTSQQMQGGKPARFGPGVKIDESGQLSPKTALLVSDYVTGEWIKAALISTDGAVKAFAKAIPFPVEAKSGPCRIWIELITKTAFLAWGEGFSPGETVQIISQSADELVEGSIDVSKDGTVAAVVFPTVADESGGKAKFTAIGETCEVGVGYAWGTALRVK